MSHLGRPDGKRVPDMSLAPVAKALGGLLGTEVKFASDCVGEPAESAVAGAAAPATCCCSRTCASTPPRRTTTRPSPSSWPSLADVYVNDAFGTAHRAHASTDGITKHLPQAAAGYLMKKELDYLGAGARQPGAPVRVHHRRLEGLVEDRRHQEPAARAWTTCCSAAA